MKINREWIILLGLALCVSVSNTFARFAYGLILSSLQAGSTPPMRSGISGQGVANPMGAILSVAMMFEHGFGQPQAARAIEQAVDNVLTAGLLPPDLGGSADTAAITQSDLNSLRPNA